MKKLIKRIIEKRDSILGFIKFALFVTALTLIFKLAPTIASYICEVSLEDMTIFVEWFMVVIFSLALLTPFFKKGE